MYTILYLPSLKCLRKNLKKNTHTHAQSIYTLHTQYARTPLYTATHSRPTAIVTYIIIYIATMDRCWLLLFPSRKYSTLYTLSLRQFLMYTGGCINKIIICRKGHSEAHFEVNTRYKVIIVIFSYLFFSRQ